jgi:hypothetical protein
MSQRQIFLLVGVIVVAIIVGFILLLPANGQAWRHGYSSDHHEPHFYSHGYGSWNYRVPRYIPPPARRYSRHNNYYNYWPSQPYYHPSYRSWIPGYWENRWTTYGWITIWIPGYWSY